MKNKLRNVLISTFPTSIIPDDISELKLGDIPEWDSLGNFNLLMAIEEDFGIRFSMEEMSNLKSIPLILHKLAI